MGVQRGPVQWLLAQHLTVLLCVLVSRCLWGAQVEWVPFVGFSGFDYFEKAAASCGLLG